MSDTQTQALNCLRGMISYDKKAKDLARDFGLSRGHMSDVLSGKKRVSKALLIALKIDGEAGKKIERKNR